ncbi:MAG: hypothetical protein IJQ12_09150 [Lachnospiraceae bacterium]|nr:hypothetical protein [Lachnospiraceae bacterium]
MNTLRWIYLATAAFIPLALYFFVLLNRRILRERIGNASVKYAMDHLPMGIAFYREDGLILLDNEAMQSLSLKLMHQRLMNGKDFHAFLLTAPAGSDFTSDGSAEAFHVISGEEVWMMQRDLRTEDGVPVVQLTAYDISELYARERELEGQVQKLRDTEAQLTQYQSRVRERAQTQAYLAAKERIHDSLGQVLLSTRYYLTEKDAKITQEEVLSAWEKTIDELDRFGTGDTKTPEEMSFLRPLEQAADALGATLNVQGHPSTDDVRMQKLVIACTRVAMINAVRHGDADEITLSFDDTGADAGWTFRISNNGRIPDVINEGGGLKSMRARVEKEGGTVSYETSPSFTVIVHVPAGGGE